MTRKRLLANQQQQIQQDQNKANGGNKKVNLSSFLFKFLSFPGYIGCNMFHNKYVFLILP